ncbi:MAG: hypothetical protein JWO85_706 [Candidatus Eremiobacteraeota bacterium]|jgi:hypothetical protein|nr:hypothetical protein [Candidatus Eremiobacteraeota bacterium]
MTDPVAISTLPPDSTPHRQPLDITIGTFNHASDDENSTRASLGDLLARSPIPANEVLSNLGLYLNRPTVSRMLFMHELYQRIIGVHGIIIEFGVRWGRNLALFEALRGIYEPYNHTRKIVGFDTFAGFPSIHQNDRATGDGLVAPGGYAVTEGYEAYLHDVLECHERESPISHMRKFELVKGDACEEIEKYLADHPETLVALAYFDMDLYEPTKRCLSAIKDRIAGGAIIGFDELNHRDFPGETIAFKEVLGAGRFKLHRSPMNPTSSYIVFGGE